MRAFLRALERRKLMMNSHKTNFLKTYQPMVVLICLLILAAWVSSATPLDNRLGPKYRGFLWFEQKELEQKQQQRKKQNRPLTKSQAQRINEDLKEKLEEKRSIMLANPTAETVRDYTIMEEEMWRRAFALEDAYREARFKYPDLYRQNENPTNVHAVKFKRQQEQQETLRKITAFARAYDLVLFSKEGCPYCTEFAPVLKSFSEIYGFSTEEASSSTKITGFFKGKSMPHLAITLGIEAFPTVVAISKDNKHAFELIRGYASISELEEYTILAMDYLKKEQSGAKDIAELGGKNSPIKSIKGRGL